MKIASQIIVHVATLLGTLFLGLFYNSSFWQMGFHARRLYNGKPLPFVSQFFVENNGLPFYLFMLPWILAVGAPWLTQASSRDYWEASAFTLRWLAFFACEALLFLLLTVFLVLPYVPHYSVMASPDTGGVERIVGWFFWVVVTGVLCLGGWRIYQSRRPSS